MSKKSNHQVVAALSQLLADSYFLQLKTQNYHWNVTGPQFGELHKLFEEQYTDIAAAVDDVAERLRALGEKTPGSFAAFSKISRIKEETGDPDAKTMLKNLANDNETLAGSCEAVIKASQEIGDE